MKFYSISTNESFSPKKHCSTQTSGDGEDDAPPSPEDKNRLKVKPKRGTYKYSCPEQNLKSSHCPDTEVYLRCFSMHVNSCSDFNHLFLQLKPSLQRGGSSASLHNSTMRNTIFQLMIHTLDPLGDGEYHISLMLR